MFLFYMVGGVLCGVVFTFQYVIYLVQRQSRWPWSGLLTLGWLLFVGGIALAIAMPNGNNPPEIAGALVVLSPLAWYATAIVAYCQAKAESQSPPDREPAEPEEGVWPPPPQPPI